MTLYVTHENFARTLNSITTYSDKYKAWQVGKFFHKEGKEAMARFRTVRNIRGTSWRSCSCGSWIEHYYNATGSRRQICGAYGCGKPAQVGAHVHKIVGRGRADWREYIVPFCHACNMTSDEIDLKVGVILVPANTQVMGCYQELYCK